MTRESVDFSPDGYLLGSYRIATAPEPNSSRLTSFKSTCFDSPANNDLDADAQQAVHEPSRDGTEVRDTPEPLVDAHAFLGPPSI